MIKFFRRIRQQLMNDNKFGKYLLYALGEILLVVLGIMIAVNINNLNEAKKNQQLEIKYLKEIKSNLEFDLLDVDFNTAFNKSKLNSNQEVLAYLNGAELLPDSLSFHLSNVMFNTRTLVNPSGYESLKSKGLALISNDSLRIQLTKLYEFDIHNLVDFETKDDHPFQYMHFIPEMMKEIKFDFTSTNSSLPHGQGALINPNMIRENAIFKNAISTNILLRQLMYDDYVNVKQNMLNTIKLINSELTLLEN